MRRPAGLLGGGESGRDLSGGQLGGGGRLSPHRRQEYPCYRAPITYPDDGRVIPVITGIGLPRRRDVPPARQSP